MCYNFLYKGKTQRYGSEVDIFEKSIVFEYKRLFFCIRKDYLFIFTTVQTKLIDA